MTGKSHAIIGAAAGYIWGGPAAIPFSVAGALLTDIDEPNSKISRMVFPKGSHSKKGRIVLGSFLTALGVYLNLKFLILIGLGVLGLAFIPHRGILHSPRELVQKTKVPFIWPNASAYYLGKKTAFSISEFLKEESKLQCWPEEPANVIQLLTANQFNCEVILSTKDIKNSGIISWLGPKDAMEKYAETDEQDKRVYNIKPEAYTVLQLPKKLGRVVYHLDVLTGEENDMIYEDKLTKYAQHLRDYWMEDLEKVSLLFLCHNPNIIPDLLQIWKTVVDKFPGDTPQIAFAYYQDIIEKGVFGEVWHVLNEKDLLSFEAFAKIEHQDHPGEFIGKQANLKFSQHNFLLRKAKESKLVDGEGA